MVHCTSHDRNVSSNISCNASQTYHSSNGDCSGTPIAPAKEPCCKEQARPSCESDEAKNLRVIQEIDSSERFQILLNFLSKNLKSNVTTMKLCAFGDSETVYGDLKRRFIVPCEVQTNAVRPATVCDFDQNYFGDVCDVLKEVNRYLQEIKYNKALGPHRLYLMTTDPIMTVTSQETGALVDLETALALAGYGVPMGAAHIKLDSSGQRQPSFVVYSSFFQSI